MSRRIAAAVLLTAALASGCGTGLEALTYQEKGREDGAVADLGGRNGIAVRHLHVAPPEHGSLLAAGSTAHVLGGLVNNGTTGDRLIDATSEAASSVTLLVDGTPTSGIDLPAEGAAPVTWSLALTGLVDAVHVAQYVPVTLSFERAGRITLQVPVLPGDNALEDREVRQDPYSVGGHGGGGKKDDKPAGH